MREPQPVLLESKGQGGVPCPVEAQKKMGLRIYEECAYFLDNHEHWKKH
jgi:hypothetical protein